MKNIIVYILAFVMMIPGLSLSADVNIKTGDLFGKNSSPFQNSPFAGGNPKNIERNLFTPKRIRIQNGNQYNVDFNHNNRQSNKAIYNVNTTNVADAAMSGGATGGTASRRYNTPLNNGGENSVATYNMASSINMISETGESGNEEVTTTPSLDNNYSGSGAPSTYNGPIEDTIWPIILFVLTYVAIKRKSKN